MMMCAASDTPPPGGGPLRGIIDDESRPEGQRALAAALVKFVKQRQHLHGRRLEPIPGVQLSFAQMKMLFHMPREGSINLSRYAESADITPAAATQALGPVEEMGFVTRLRSDTDRRSVDIALTDQGRALLESLATRFAGRWDDKVAHLSDDDLAVAARVLDAMLDVFAP